MTDGEAPGDRGGEGVALGVLAPVPLALKELLPVLEALAPTVTEAVGDADWVLLVDTVDEGVAAAVPVPEVVPLLVGVAEGDCDPVTLPLKEALPVPEAEAPGVTGAVGLPDTVLLALIVEEGVAEGVPVLLAVPVAVIAALGVCVPVPLELREGLPVLEGDTPRVRDAEGVADTVVLADNVEDGVTALVPVPLGVAHAVDVPVPLWLDVPLLDRDRDGVMLADSPVDSEGVGEDDRVELALVVDERAAASVPVLLPLTELLPLLEAGAPRVADAVGEADCVPVQVGVELAVGVAEGH